MLYQTFVAVGRSVEFVDAPVSGGVNAAAAGTLTFMVGADSEAAFNRAKLVLDSMGAKVTRFAGVDESLASDKLK